MQYIYTCATDFLHVNQSWLPFLVGSSVGCPLNCPLYPYLKVVGCPLSCTLSCPLFSYMEVVGSLICMAKFPWAAHGSPLRFPRAALGQRSGQLPCFFRMGKGLSRLHLTKFLILCNTHLTHSTEMFDPKKSEGKKKQK